MDNDDQEGMVKAEKGDKQTKLMRKSGNNKNIGECRDSVREGDFGLIVNLINLECLNARSFIVCHYLFKK